MPSLPKYSIKHNELFLVQRFKMFTKTAHTTTVTMTNTQQYKIMKHQTYISLKRHNASNNVARTSCTLLYWLSHQRYQTTSIKRHAVSIFL